MNNNVIELLRPNLYDPEMTTIKEYINKDILSIEELPNGNKFISNRIFKYTTNLVNDHINKLSRKTLKNMITASTVNDEYVFKGNDIFIEPFNLIAFTYGVTIVCNAYVKDDNGKYVYFNLIPCINIDNLFSYKSGIKLFGIIQSINSSFHMSFESEAKLKILLGEDYLEQDASKVLRLNINGDIVPLCDIDHLLKMD